MNDEAAFDYFIESVRRTCSAIEKFDARKIDDLLAALIELLGCAHDITRRTVDVVDDELCIPTATVNQLDNVPEGIVFYEVFDPLDLKSACATSLKDSLGDIYASLKGGLSVLDQEQGKKSDVLWEWRNDFEHHWGRHLIDVVRFLLLSKDRVTSLVTPA